MHVLWFASIVLAHFGRTDIEQVPIDRVLANLNAQATKTPEDFDVRMRLARANALAFTMKGSTDIKVEVVKVNKSTGAVWEGNLPDPLPPESRFIDPKHQPKRYLREAMVHYQTAVKLRPDAPLAQLGLAWCYEVDGQKQEAIDRYRKIFASQWKVEHDEQWNLAGQKFVSVEAGKQLIRLLDATKDAAEIEVIQQRSRDVENSVRAITPILLPMTGATSLADITSVDEVSFDLDGSGARLWQWPSELGGWLVYDPTHSGQITSGLQMFGSVTFWLFWRNGYEAMRSLDDDRDGFLRGRELEGIAVWCDKNRDGISDPGEVQAIKTLGIVGLATSATNSTDVALSNPRGVEHANGTLTPSFDWIPTSRARRPSNDR